MSRRANFELAHITARHLRLILSKRAQQITSNQLSIKEFVMGGKVDQVKGRVKEAAGALTDDDRLRTEGKLDQAKGKVKETIDKVADKTKDTIDRVTNE